jgi:putative membrane protein
MMWGYGPNSGMMGWGYGGSGGFGMIIWVIILIAIVAGVVWLVRGGAASGMQPPARRSAGLEVLEERYARGEINRDEYLQKKRDLGG